MFKTGSRRIIIIGMDGVPYDLLKNLGEQNVISHLPKTIAGGTFKKVCSTIPEISSVAWSSIITGKNPGEHGIFGFTDLFPKSYSLKFPNFTDIKSPPFWNLVAGRSIIINVPSTYPVKPMRGVHISGFVSIDLERSVYPSSLVPKLEELDYRLDVDSEKAHKSLELFLADLNQTLKSRIELSKCLWEDEDWQIFMLVFTGTDRLMHFLWEAYENNNHPYRQEFLNHFKKIDEYIGEINSKLKDDDLLVVMSDHGFESLDKDIYMNYLLSKEGFLNFKDQDKEKALSNIDFSTKAFALDPARIYINLKGEYPQGSVEAGDREKVISELIALFNTLEIDNKKVIKNIYRKEEIYAGDYLAQAPDLILLGNQGFNLRGNIKADKLVDKGIFTGKHSQDNAFLLLNRDYNKDIISDNLSVNDIVKIIFGDYA